SSPPPIYQPLEETVNKQDGVHFDSLQWMWALRDSDVDPRLRLLGFVLMSFADKNGKTRPSLAKLALMMVKEDGSSWSESTIKSDRRELVRLGCLVLAEKGTGRGQSSVYSLSLPGENGSRKRVTDSQRKRVTLDPPSETSSELLGVGSLEPTHQEVVV